MTDKKISQLTPITGADMLDSDELVVARESTSENFSVTRAELLQGSGVVVDDDFTSNGLLKRTAEGVYGIAVEDTDYQGVPAEGAFVDGDKTKLDGIEAGADVTDTANVTAAGALMDSELTSIASVKALDQGVATTDSPQFASLGVGGDPGANIELLVKSTTQTNNVVLEAPITNKISMTSTAGGSGYDIELTQSYADASFLISQSGTNLVRWTGYSAIDTMEIYNSGAIAAAFEKGDFWVDTDTLFVDASTDRVGINTASPQSDLDIRNTGVVSAQITSSGDSANFLIQAADGYVSRLWFGDATDFDVGAIEYAHTGNSMVFKTGGATRMTLSGTGLDVVDDLTAGGNLTFGGVEIETPQHNGAAVDGTTNDATALDAMVTAMQTNNGMGVFPAGSYNDGGTVYTLTHDNLTHVGDYTGSFNPLVGARQHSMTIFAETVTDATFDGDKTRIGLAVNAYAKGGQRADGIRVNGYNQSTGSNGGVTGTYTAMTSDTGADWSAASHSELYHAAGTGIGSDIEVTGFSSSGSIYGLVVHNVTGSAHNSGQTHSITGASPDMPSTNAAINITGSQQYLDDGGWMTGIEFSTTALHPSATAIHVKDDASIGFRAGGSYSTAAFMMESGEEFAFEGTAAIGMSYQSGSIVFRNGATNRMTLGMGTGDLDLSGAIQFAPSSSETPTNNGDVVFELTSNTTLTIKAKGSDGVVRSGTVTLS